MTLKGQFKAYDEIVKYEITDAQKDKIIKRLMKYYEEHGYTGECIQQCDDAIIEAPNVLSEICDDLIKFKSSNKEE